MSALSSLSDAELVAKLPALVAVERNSTADVIEHLVEMERRRLYLAHATSSLYRYCIERLGYSEDAALKRHRVALLALRLPQTLEELRAGTIHLTGLFLLSTHLTENNVDALLTEARGKSRRALEELIARWFPRHDVPSRIEPILPTELGFSFGESLTFQQRRTLDTEPRPGETCCTCPETGNPAARSGLEPLSPARWRVEFTASAALRDKLVQAQELLSHAIPNGDLGQLFERALDALLAQETRKRLGTGRPRKARIPKSGSRHVPLDVARAVWKRDGAQCTYMDTEGHRCSERRFLTLEHRHPFALEGPSTLDNLCLLCTAHNLANGRDVFGERPIDVPPSARIRLSSNRPLAVPQAARSAHTVGEMLPDSEGRVLSALCTMGFRRREAVTAIKRVQDDDPGVELRQLLMRSLLQLVPARSRGTGGGCPLAAR